MTEELADVQLWQTEEILLLRNMYFSKKLAVIEFGSLTNNQVTLRSENTRRSTGQDIRY